MPLVREPGRVPVVTGASDAVRQPEPVVLSALAHGPRRDRTGVLDALISGLEAVDLEALMANPTFEYQSDFVRKFVFQGRAEGKIDTLLEILDARDVDVPAHGVHRQCPAQPVGAASSHREVRRRHLLGLTVAARSGRYQSR